MEKPFGTDLASAQALNATLHSVFDESQIFRIDHFLGKEAVQNILALRFANGLFEPIWNRDHIADVQIDVPETLGDRGPRAVLRRRPAPSATWSSRTCSRCSASWRWSRRPRSSANALRDEKAEGLRGDAAARPGDVVRGQYEGYRDEPGVPADSDTETFVAVRAQIDNWRWAGVPFYLRTGKRLPAARTSSRSASASRRCDMFPTDATRPSPATELVFDFGDPGSIAARLPGEGARTGDDARRGRTWTSSTASLRPDGRGSRATSGSSTTRCSATSTLFTRSEGIERLWEVSAPLLADPPPVQPYAQGSWGPAAADALVAPQEWQLTSAHPAAG